MAGGGTHRGGRLPFDDAELLVSAFDHIPADRILADRPANLALKFFQTRHVSPAELSLPRQYSGNPRPVTPRMELGPFPNPCQTEFSTKLADYFLAASSRLRSAAMVAAEVSLRLLFLGRRLVLLL